jgi:uncharacterized membrane protein
MVVRKALVYIGYHLLKNQINWLSLVMQGGKSDKLEENIWLQGKDWP